MGFRYPGIGALGRARTSTFTLAPGERLALVGENGAGKTTLVKLLARLYDPTEGRILLDGVDLREYDVDSLRRNIGVIFQDFVRYDFLLRENIAVGQHRASWRTSPRIRDGGRAEPGRHGRRAGSPGGTTRCWGAGSTAGWTCRAASGRRWRWRGRTCATPSCSSSTSRPPHSMPAPSTRCSSVSAELTAGRMAVLISHRFSTVRMADRILVLQGGELVEQGTHEELVARGGLYAELFQLQAAGYR